MKAYVRTRDRRAGAREGQLALAEREAPPGPSLGPRPGVPADWGRFTRAFQEALAGAGPGEQRGLARLVHCTRLDLRQAFGCGSERRALSAWCGLAYCPACARERAAGAARFVRESWEAERLLWVRIPLSEPGGLTLPEPAAVAAARTAWSRLTQRLADASGLPRLESLPRCVLDPDGLSLFVRLPWAGAGSSRAARAAETVLRDLSMALAPTEGCRPSRVRIISRDAAAQQVQASLSREAERFVGLVAGDLERLETLAWRASFPRDASRDATLRATARRWLQRVRERQRSSRRELMPGAKSSLPAPPAPRPGRTKQVCPAHGGGCAPLEWRVRDLAAAGRVVERPEQAPRSTGRQVLAAFFRQAEGAGARRRKAG